MKLSYGLEASLSGTDNKAEALLDNTEEREGTFDLTQRGAFGRRFSAVSVAF